MKCIKHYIKMALLTVLLALTVPAVVPVPGQMNTVEAAKKISRESVILLKGQTITLKVNGTNDKPKWTSKAKSIAAVNEKGKVTAKKAGTTTVTAKIKNKKYTCEIIVQDPSLSAKAITLSSGQSKSLQLNGTNQKVTWKSSNSSIAAVNADGKITAKKPGSVTITAAVLKKTYTCRVTVKSSGSGSSNSNAQTTASGNVWIPRSGTKYHKSASCSGMRSPQSVSLSEAIRLGFEPCKKCY